MTGWAPIWPPSFTWGIRFDAGFNGDKLAANTKFQLQLSGELGTPDCAMSEFSKSVIDLIRTCAPNFSAVEVLVYLEARPGKIWQVNELTDCLQPRGISSAAITAIVARFRRCGLIEGDEQGGFRYCPASPELADRVKLLVAAFHERPVSLIRAIYAIADESIQSFADSFRLKNE